MLRKLNRLWKIVREINLEVIRQRAEAPVRIMVVADSAANRDAMAALLMGDPNARHPWLSPARPDQGGASISHLPADLALIVSRTSDLPGPLESARNILVSKTIPVVTVLVGSFGHRQTLTRRGERRHVALPSLNPDQAETLASTLFDLVASDTRIALARNFPGLRQPFFDQIIEETSRANASYAFSTGLAEVVPLLDLPLNIGDIVVLTKNQLIMAYRIALAAGKEGRPADVIGEVMGVVGGSLMCRQVARELIGLIPVIGIIPKVAVAYGGTWAIGRAVVAWATGAEEATKRSLQHLYAAGLDRGREVARQLTSRFSRVA
jgi:uncharacterized protein (DUF697 family)